MGLSNVRVGKPARGSNAHSSSRTTGLEGSGNFFWKGPDSKYLRLYRPHSLRGSDLALPGQGGRSHRPHGNGP